MTRPTAKKKFRSAALDVSVVVPALNEELNIGELVKRLAESLAGRTYEILIVDDHSTDKTAKVARSLRKSFPVKLLIKRGAAGKASSLCQGFAKARGATLVMIDADLQYPPEALPEMLRLIEANEADVVVANRTRMHTSRIRLLSSRMFKSVFGKRLWGLDLDVQSGLKVFKREVFDRADIDQKKSWAFDLQFLLTAKNADYRLQSHDIDFESRVRGRSKVRVVRVAAQLAFNALRLKLSPPTIVFSSKEQTLSEGRSLHYRGKKYVTYTNLSKDNLAIERTDLRQRFLIGLAAILLVASLIVDWHLSLIIFFSSITVLYFIDFLFNLYLVMGSFYKEPEITVSEKEIGRKRVWPKYTVFCPLYKESAVVQQFIAAMRELDYPKDKLEVQLLMEEDDVETVEHIKKMSLPGYFKLIIVPDSLPKTKPKACNYGLTQATGEYAVIYDAEDIPDPLQLKKAVVAFKKSSKNVGCIQAKLNYYNWDQNLLTRLFALEYSLWYNLVLTGLQSVGSPIPLGGTSNHFRTKDLRRLKGWDPFNVTEDADLGMRIAKSGMYTAILDSTTLEEANSDYLNWFKQRSRWIKGYIQTYFVHMRRPRDFFSASGFRHLIIFQAVIGGIVSILLNPLLWIMTAAYFIFPGSVAEFVESLYPTPIYYMGLVSLVAGNFLYMYYYMMGAAKQNRPELILYALAIPIYWVMMCIAAVYALRDFIVRPFHWHKTKHGLHLQPEKTFDFDDELAPENVAI